MKKNKYKKYYLIFAIVLLLSSIFFLFRKKDTEISLLAVERGNLVQELFETGFTEKGQDISLSFKEGGRIDGFLVKEGEKISQETIIAFLDKKDLELSLKKAEAIFSSAEAALDKLLKGATKEELDVIESAVKLSETNLLSSEENLKEQKKIANETLKRTYQNVATLLGDVFSAVKETEIGIERISNIYFTSFYVSETISGRRSRDIIVRSVEKIEKYKNLGISSSIDFKEKKEALSKTEEELKIIIEEIDNFVVVADSDFYKDKFSDTDKSIIREYRVSVNKKLADVISLYGNISLVDAEVNAKLTTAERAVASAKDSLNQSRKEFSRISATPDANDITMSQSTVNQAEVRMERLRNRIKDTVLKSPVAGVVSLVLAREGEIVSPGIPAIVVIPEEEIQITVNIYEGDIPKISVGNKVKASFVSFPEKDFHGEVIFINPAGKIIDGIVYYTIKIVLDKYPENVLPQMTVDVTIRTAEKENVLFLPERVIQRKDGKNLVKVLENGEIIEKEVETGLKGEGRMVEIVSGINEKEKVLNN